MATGRPTKARALPTPDQQRARAAVRGAVSGFTMEDLEIMHELFCGQIESMQEQIGELTRDILGLQDQIDGKKKRLERLRRLIDYLEDAGVGLAEDDED